LDQGTFPNSGRVCCGSGGYSVQLTLHTLADRTTDRLLQGFPSGSFDPKLLGNHLDPFGTNLRSRAEDTHAKEETGTVLTKDRPGLSSRAAFNTLPEFIHSIRVNTVQLTQTLEGRTDKWVVLYAHFEPSAKIFGGTDSSFDKAGAVGLSLGTLRRANDLGHLLLPPQFL
jgi:hypothetical protein